MYLIIAKKYIALHEANQVVLMIKLP